MESAELTGSPCDFILAGNAIITLKSKKTGKHFTYRIRKKKNQDVWFVSALYNPSDQMYSYIGCITEFGKFVHTKKSQVNSDSPVFQAFCWSWNNLRSEKLEIWHEGRCGRCGKSLTDPESIQRGFGPYCWGKINE